MQKTHLLATVAGAALLTLSACGEPEIVTVNRFDAQAEALKNAAPVAPPPMIQATRSYRCRDNSLIYVDFYTNNSALVRNELGGDPVASLTAQGGNPPYVGQEGYALSGDGENVSYTSPGRGTQPCHT